MQSSVGCKSHTTVASSCNKSLITNGSHKLNPTKSVRKAHAGCGEWLLDGVDAYDGDAIAWHDSVAEIAVTVELDVARQLTVGHRFRRLLQLQQLVVDALTLLWNDEERIHRTLGTARLITTTQHNTIEHCNTKGDTDVIAFHIHVSCSHRHDVRKTPRSVGYSDITLLVTEWLIIQTFSKTN